LPLCTDACDAVGGIAGLLNGWQLATGCAEERRTAALQQQAGLSRLADEREEYAQLQPSRWGKGGDQKETHIEKCSMQDIDSTVPVSAACEHSS